MGNHRRHLGEPEIRERRCPHGGNREAAWQMPRPHHIEKQVRIAPQRTRIKTGAPNVEGWREVTRGRAAGACRREVRPRFRYDTGPAKGQTDGSCVLPAM